LTTGAELLFDIFSQRYERGSTIVTSNLPFEGWTAVFGAERLTGALLERPTHHVGVGALAFAADAVSRYSPRAGSYAGVGDSWRYGRSPQAQSRRRGG
jgi:hypothetical protein